ncbi:hypothetical protein MRX96_049120 [Rhipicephalus microplus]
MSREKKKKRGMMMKKRRRRRQRAASSYPSLGPTTSGNAGRPRGRSHSRHRLLLDRPGTSRRIARHSSAATTVTRALAITTGEAALSRRLRVHHVYPASTRAHTHTHTRATFAGNGEDKAASNGFEKEKALLRYAYGPQRH